MKILLLQLDGKLPNVALMRLAAHHCGRGDDVELRHAPTVPAVERGLWDRPGRVYASLIFERTRPVAEAVRRVYPDALVGGTGWDLVTTLERDAGVATLAQDYAVYPRYRQSIGFTQRGCRLKCAFCVVPAREGAAREEQTVASLWRGEPWPRELVLLDNDFFGQPNWRDRIAEIKSGGFRVNFCQGINARMLSDEAAAALASVDYRDTRMDARRIHTAWDSMGDERPLFRGLDALRAHGVKPDHVMVYMLIGYPSPVLTPGDFYRRQKLREWGARPYPMPYVRTPATVGFQRWVVGAYDKRVPWREWEAAGYEPRRLGARAAEPLLPFGQEVT